MEYTMPSDAKEQLESLLADIRKDYPFFIGFPGAVDFDYKDLYPFFGYLLNNIGDPYVDPLHTNHSKKLEKEVVTFFADLFMAPKNDRWGYVTNGGTEGNLYAMYVARALYPNAIVYYSSSAHYSIAKNAYILAMESEEVKSQESGEIDYEDFRKQVLKHADRPAVIVATIGTTMTEAKDNIYVIGRILKECGIKESFIHCDAALAGVYTSFVLPHHPFDFSDGADSISISGHKFIGSPMACGVVVTRKTYKDKIERDSRYVGSPDTTISGSRNGHTPIMLWYTIKRLGVEGLRNRAFASMELARYLHTELQCLGWPSWQNAYSFTVVIKKPPKELVHKWQLATYGDISHIICMPGVTKEKINEFIHDIKDLGRRPRDGGSKKHA